MLDVVDFPAVHQSITAKHVLRTEMTMHLRTS